MSIDTGRSKLFCSTRVAVTTMGERLSVLASSSAKLICGMVFAMRIASVIGFSLMDILNSLKLSGEFRLTDFTGNEVLVHQHFHEFNH